MVSDRDSLKDILSRVDEYVDSTREAMRTALGEGALGMVPASDAEFIAEFDRLKKQNVNWLLALGFVEGGLEHIARYERLSLHSRLLGSTDGGMA